MPNKHRADPTPPPHHGQGRGGSKKESSSLRVSPALHPPERPSPRRADIADHGLGRETREPRTGEILIIYHKQDDSNVAVVVGGIVCFLVSHLRPMIDRPQRAK